MNSTIQNVAGARLSSGNSSFQNYSTPDHFINAVYKRFGYCSWDLAADNTNKKAFYFFTEEENSLTKEWHKLSHNVSDDSLLWLNPPYRDITTWAKKCAEESKKGANILFLVPASVGSNWFADFVWKCSNIYYLQGRLSFDGKAPYPKDCMLCFYGPKALQLTEHYTTHVWDWRNNVIK